MRTWTVRMAGIEYRVIMLNDRRVIWALQCATRSTPSVHWSRTSHVSDMHFSWIDGINHRYSIISYHTSPATTIASRRWRTEGLNSEEVNGYYRVISWADPWFCLLPLGLHWSAGRHKESTKGGLRSNDAILKRVDSWTLDGIVSRWQCEGWTRVQDDRPHLKFRSWRLEDSKSMPNVLDCLFSIITFIMLIQLTQ